jgi:hypothetical protein
VSAALREARRLEDRFMSKVVWNGDEDECWIWEGNKTSTGYGRFRVGEKQVGAHRVAYELFVGPIPESFDVDHVKARGCRSRACVNPAHLEAVTHRENTLRGGNPAAINARKSHCKRGHPLSGENLYVQPSSGKRQCRACLPITRAERRRPHERHR